MKQSRNNVKFSIKSNLRFTLKMKVDIGLQHIMILKVLSKNMSRIPAFLFV